MTAATPPCGCTYALSDNLSVRPHTRSPRMGTGKAAHPCGCTYVWSIHSSMQFHICSPLRGTAAANPPCGCTYALSDFFSLWLNVRSRPLGTGTAALPRGCDYVFLSSVFSEVQKKEQRKKLHYSWPADTRKGGRGQAAGRASGHQCLFLVCHRPLLSPPLSHTFPHLLDRAAADTAVTITAFTATRHC